MCYVSLCVLYMSLCIVYVCVCVVCICMFYMSVCNVLWVVLYMGVCSVCVLCGGVHVHMCENNLRCCPSGTMHFYVERESHWPGSC